MRTSFFVSSVLCLLLGLCFSLSLCAESWTVFHGLKEDNISPETGLLKSWGDAGPKLLWKNEEIGNAEPAGFSGVTVNDNRIFTTGNVRENADSDANSTVFALDAATGKTLWKYNNGPGWNGHYGGVRSTPTIDAERIYAYSEQGRLACLDAATGKEIWVRNIKEDTEASLPKWAFAESVKIDGNKVICWPGGKKAAVVALDKMTGKTIWETPSFGEIASYATMIIFEQGGLRIYANMNQKNIVGVNAENGKLLFTAEQPTQYDVNATMPYYFDGKILASSGYGTTGTRLWKLTVEDGKCSMERIWEQKALDNQHGGLIVWDGYIYGSAHKYNKGAWLCLDIADGSIKWESNEIGQGCVSAADGMLYCLAEKDGAVVLLKPNKEKYEEISRFKLPKEGTGNYWAHPVICNKKLYLRHDNFLYCYDVSDTGNR